MYNKIHPPVKNNDNTITCPFYGGNSGRVTVACEDFDAIKNGDITVETNRLQDCLSPQTVQNALIALVYDIFCNENIVETAPYKP